MQKSNAPTQYVIPWANAGTKNSIPVASQIGITNGAASFTDGYPPLTFTPIASGGVPPFGSDTNGILYDETLSTLWQQSGFHYAFNSTFNTNQGGYPAQAILARSDGRGLWLNLADNNTTNPDATGAFNWTSVRANIGSTTIAVVVGNNTPDPSVLGPRLLIITGSIASTASLILPLVAGASWTIQNNTSGAGSLSVQGATGSGVTVAQGTTADVITDGTNFYTSTFNGSGVFLPINGTAVAATKLATARTIAMTGDVSWTSPAFDGTANVSAAGTISAGVVTLSKMAAFQANSLMGNPTGSTATPQAITLTSGIQFSGTALGLGAITPSSVVTTGIVTSSSTITFNGTIQSSQPNCILAATGAGAIFLRPNGALSTTGQASIDSSGNLITAGNITANGSVTAANVISSGSVTAASITSNGTLTAAGVLTAAAGVFIATGAEVDVFFKYNNSAAFQVYMSNASGTFNVNYTNSSGTLVGAAMQINNTNGNVSIGNLSAATFSATTSAIFTCVPLISLGTVATQISALRIAYNDGVVRWVHVMESDASYSLYSFSSSGASIARALNLTQAGNLTTTGTINFSTSDESLKDQIDRKAQPEALHRDVPFATYRRTDTGEYGRDLIAQDLQKKQPLYTRDFDGVLFAAKGAAAFEQAWWCGYEIDRILPRLDEIERRLGIH